MMPSADRCFAPRRRSLLLGAGAALALAHRGLAASAAADRFAELEHSAGARIGVAGLNTGTAAAVGHRADERFAFCSTFKLLAVSAILTRSRSDPALLARRIEYTAQDLVPYSPVSSQHAGEGMTVAAICAAALQYSDNTAANLMIRLLGSPDAVTSFARSIGDTAFRLDRWETALNAAVPGDPRDTTTPAAMMSDLQRAALGDLLGPPDRERLVTWMRGCTTGLRRIRAAVPAGWLVGDKTGSGDYGTANDIAVIWPPGRAPVVLAIYTTQATKDAPARDNVDAPARDDVDAPARDDVVATAARIALDAIA